MPATLALLLLPLPALAQGPTCPALAGYYPADTDAWPRTLTQLEPLLTSCLQSAEYFALLGAAQLNTGRIALARESLERALLLDPDHGAAGIDYAETLFIAGDLFPALEFNDNLLRRSDLPPALRDRLAERGRIWQMQTRQSGFQAELSLGHDNNLNGAPARGEFTLTRSGEPVQLTLDPEYQPKSGAYVNMRLSGFYRQRGPERGHDLMFSLRNRQSQHQESELLQFDWRYAYRIPLRDYVADLGVGTGHLLYGGSPLYSVSEARARLRHERHGRCQPQAELATQHQYYHGQSFVSGVETSLWGGVECTMAGGTQLFSLEAGPVYNHALDAERPGADREGWALQLGWQMRLGTGLLISQLGYTRLQDSSGYSDLLANGANREIHSRRFHLQYSRPLDIGVGLLVNLSHQEQGSNIQPFENKGTAVDVGVNYNF